MMGDSVWFPKYALSSEEHKKLFMEHYKRLNDSDRGRVRSAFYTIYTYVALGASVALGVGLFLGSRSRGSRLKTLMGFKTTEKPIAIVFANGRTGMITHPFLRLSAPTPLLLNYCMRLVILSFHYRIDH